MADNKKKKIVAGIMSGLTAFSLTLGGLFDSAEELKADYPQNPKAVIESIDDYSEDNLEENEAHDSFKEKLKRLIYKIPVKIRTIFFVPLWALGSLLISLIDTLFKTIFVPIAHIIGGFIIETLIMLAVIVLCIKILFPDIPLRKILSKKLIILVVVSSLIIKICDVILPNYIESYDTYRFIFKSVMGLIFTGIILLPYIKKKLKNRVTYDIVYDKQLLK